MDKRFRFELAQLHKHRLMIFLIAYFSQLIFLYFFTVVGRFDGSESNDVLNNYTTLSGLASTICMCILVVYGTVVMNRFLVNNYIGENKIRLYLYPSGRSQLFYTKIVSFCVIFFFYQFIGVALSNAIYLLTETFIPILNASQPASMFVIQFLVTSLAGVVLTISIILLSGIVGIYLNSTVATIVTGIVLIVVFGNVLAMAFVSDLLVTLGSSILIAFIVGVGIKRTGHRIENDEGLSK